VSASTDHQPSQQVLLRKHSKQSLSQPTIPEEGPEHLLAESEDQPQQVMVVPPSGTVSKGLQQGPVPIAKNLAKELCASGGAISKRATPSLPSVKSTPQAAPAVTASEPTVQKSPKTSHKTHESTVQRITKAIRGSGRSDSKSKKKDGREASPSPSKRPDQGQGQKVSRRLWEKERAGEKRNLQEFTLRNGVTQW